MVYKKAKTESEAKRIQEFLEEKGIGASVKRNEGFLSDTYPFHVVGSDEAALGIIERHEAIVNAISGKRKRKATWNKPRSRWNETPKRIRT